MYVGPGLFLSMDAGIDPGVILFEVVERT